MIVVVTELLRETHVRFPSTLVHWELLVWWLASAVYLLRFMMLGEVDLQLKGFPDTLRCEMPHEFP